MIKQTSPPEEVKIPPNERQDTIEDDQTEAILNDLLKQAAEEKKTGNDQQVRSRRHSAIV